MLLASYVAMRAQAPPGGPPPPLVLSEFKWETWQNPGLPRMPTDIGTDGPAPRRELTGLWDPARGGIGARGARGMPAPLTAWGEAKGKTHKSGDGVRMVDAPDINDPLSTQGDPGGYPRQLLFELRQVQFLPTRYSIVAAFMWERRYRTIWTDGRQLPADPDPRWYGYSVGAGQTTTRSSSIPTAPTSERGSTTPATRTAIEMKVEERWHRLSEKRLELTVTLDDPKAYTRPWVALDKLPFVQIPENVDLMEMMNAATEVQAVAAAFKAERELERNRRRRHGNALKEASMRQCLRLIALVAAVSVGYLAADRLIPVQAQSARRHGEFLRRHE